MRRTEDVANDSSAFDKDFGYLMPFLDKVAAAASTLPDASARAELSRLMAEEKARWLRIQELLRGAQGRGAGAALPVPPSPSVAPPLARASSDNIHRVAPLAAGLTVGSLKPTR
jgi:hypothetical protein